ncbi:hypothetical protein LMH87_011692 [Akanthomyces muscarius]|uniref:Uncharacterized protein n=1 Tax=Akanthomyces muscarius TaxID=2231603 RepID=A0A9W8QC90_AKAMU|nr:hypothetical protein LMH87_011692 [Akanthomyces muscarius]KAJ4150968.1 hypothetical protein LMH87_011692 [Akanthomyces muscarius]
MAVADNMSTHQRRQSEPSIPTSDLILRETQYLYSFTLLIAFVSCVAWYSIYNAKKQESIVQSQALTLARLPKTSSGIWLE